MRFRPRGRAQPVRATTCSLGRVAFGRARGRGEFERVAAAHEDLSVCVPMCSRQPPGELAWGRAPGETKGRATPLDAFSSWETPTRSEIFLRRVFGVTTQHVCGGSGSPNHNEGAPAALGGGSKRCRRASPRDHARRRRRPRRGRGTHTSRRQRRGSFAPRRRAPVTIWRCYGAGLHRGPRATDGHQQDR